MGAKHLLVMFAITVVSIGIVNNVKFLRDLVATKA